ncbi:MAG: SurA N-terminal domain-containing protein [Erythrobacter sp.]|uniref:peptidylprolyl isomerase n=1 Tax=Erythrobacter sp. TaxID=1042 RepID=UPI0026268BA4|nr:peptidylprolyl isomerase [Erythrobacter sp.]MDJ0977785.1 SurA N-terminal domain-containing protein [Erythrobacter sp.]
MITSFRKFFQSKIGMAFFLGFLALVALAFAGADITGNTFGGLARGERVALVGDDAVTNAELVETAQSTLRSVRRENPTLTMPTFIAEGGLDEVLSQMIDRLAIAAFAEDAGLRAGENLVNSEILQIGAFRGVSGEFDQQVYQQALADQRISDATLRRDLSDGLLAQQMLLPAIVAPRMPDKVTRRYASLFLERRSGAIALIPSALYTTEDEPDAAALEAYYIANRTDYILPERRTLRFAVFNTDNLTDDVTPSEAEIAARYKENEDQYAAREARDVTSFTVPTEEGAKAIVEQIRAGKSLEAAARDAGFNTTQALDRDREQYASSVSFAAAQAVFAAGQGEVAEPAQSTLGYVIARVDKITNTPARSLDEVRDEITQALTQEKRAAALGDLSARIEAEVDQGTSLTEIADAFDLTLDESPPLLADGRVFGDPTTAPNPALRPILDTAFSLDESQPQLDVLVPGSQFLVYDVTSITESAAPPLAEIRDRIARDYGLAEASKIARQTAQRVVDRVRNDTSLTAALGEEDKPLPAPDDVTLGRPELQQLSARGPVPPALALMFSMAEGTTKLLEAPGNQGWIIVTLDEITSDDVEPGSPILAGLSQEFVQTLSAEYSDQLSKAMRESVGVETNESALEEVRAQLAGGES